MPFLVLSITFALSGLSYHYFEMPIRRWATSFHHRPAHAPRPAPAPVPYSSGNDLARA